MCLLLVHTCIRMFFQTFTSVSPFNDVCADVVSTSFSVSLLRSNKKLCEKHPEKSCLSDRAGVKPFEQARSVLATLSDVPEDVKAQIEDKAKNTGKMKSESPDLLQLCNLVPLEAIGLGMLMCRFYDRNMFACVQS